MAPRKPPTVHNTGTEIILPANMSLDQGIEWLRKRKVEEEAVIDVSETVDAHPLDGAHAFLLAMQEKYGWVQAVPTQGFFGDRPPTWLPVQVHADGTTVQVPWGTFQIPGISGSVECGVTWGPGGFAQFTLSGEIKRKHKDEFAALATLVRATVRTQSLFKGRALQVKFPRDAHGRVEIMGSGMPRPMDLDSVVKEDLIFPADTAELIDAALFTPIEHTAACRTHKIPLKRGVLLEGPYGTGKTLTAAVTAKRCVEQGWTFLYLENLDDLAPAIRFAEKYGPAVIFAEDLDSLVNGDRDNNTNDVLNTLDGVDTKNTEVIVVLTTNHVENIHPAMLRPGRLDAVIPVRPPDAPAAERLMRLYGRNLIDPAESLSAAGAALAGQIPAVIREVVERSKLNAIRRGGTLMLTGADLLSAARGMLSHLELIKPKAPDTRSVQEKAAEIVADAIRSNPAPTRNGKGATALPETYYTPVLD